MQGLQRAGSKQMSLCGGICLTNGQVEQLELAGCPMPSLGKKNTKAELQVFWSGGGGSGAAHVQAPSSLCCALQAWAAPLRSGAPTPLTSVQQSPLGGCSEGGERRHPLLLCPALPPERPFLPPELGERENRAPPTLAWAWLRWTLLKKHPLQFQCASRLL